MSNLLNDLQKEYTVEKANRDREALKKQAIKDAEKAERDEKIKIQNEVSEIFYNYVREVEKVKFDLILSCHFPQPPYDNDEKALASEFERYDLPYKIEIRYSEKNVTRHLAVDINEYKVFFDLKEEYLTFWQKTGLDDREGTFDGRYEKFGRKNSHISKKTEKVGIQDLTDCLEWLLFREEAPIKLKTDSRKEFEKLCKDILGCMGVWTGIILVILLIVWIISELRK